MGTIDPGTDKPYEVEEAGVLLGKNREMGTGLNLTKATVVILCKPIYNSGLFFQIPKRAYRYGQNKKVTFYVLQANTIIEAIVDEKRQKNALFTAETFRKMIKEVNEGDVDRPIDVDLIDE